MKKYLHFINILLFLFSLSHRAGAQTNQTVVNGGITTPVNFPASGCPYHWFNNTPGIGIPATGTGNISSFTAVNNGSTPMTATITAKPVSAGIAYVPDVSSGNVSVIDLSNNSVISTIPVGNSPLGVSVSPDGSRVYITNQQSGSISVINAATNTVTATITTAMGADPSGIVVSPDGTRLYFTNYQLNTISVINTGTNTLLSTINVGSNPYGIAVSPGGNRVYVSNANDGTVSVINTATNTVVSTITVGIAPNGLRLSPDGSRLYVANYMTNNVSVINTANNTVITTLGAGASPIDVAISPDGNTLYVSNINDNTVSVINTSTSTLIANVNTGSAPFGLSLSPDGTKLYVTSAGSKLVTVINTLTNTDLTTLTTGSAAISIGNFITGGVGCNSTPISFTITVNPASLTSPTITTTPATGTISACVGSASVSPNIQQFTVSGSSLTDVITATAPPGFEISFSAGGTYGSSVSLSEAGGTTNSTILYVRSAATDPAGNISGNVVLNSPGATTQNVAVTGTVNALPTVNTVANQTVNGGQNTTSVNFTGTGNTYTWTNNTPGIGLPASGASNIAPFNATNTGSTPLKATVTVTPQSAGFAYIANISSNTVSVVNTGTNTIVATIPVGTNPWGVAVTPDGSRVYVSNQTSNNVSVISTTTNIVLTTINVGRSPEGIAVSPDGTRVYVTNLIDNTVSVISTATNTVIATITAGINARGIAVSPDGSTIYVANGVDGTLSVINTSTNSIITTITLGTNPFAVAISPDGSKVYVTLGGGVSVVDTKSNSVVTTINAGAGPTGVVVSPDGSKVYVTNSNSNTVSVIDASTNTVTSTIISAYHSSGISISPDGALIYVTSFSDGTLSTINTVTGLIIATVTVGINPGSIGNFLTNTGTCSGMPITFTITVNPPPPAITAGTATGNISACLGSPSASPNVEQLTVSGSNLTGDVTAAAPAGFEVSLSANSGYGNSLTVTQTAGTANSTIVYVRSAASSSTGNISGNIVLTSPGATTQNIAVTGTINPLPTVIPVANKTFTSGSPTTAINFTGTGISFTWTNDTPGIGLPASGAGNISSFAGINTGSSPVMATIVVTPTSATGCNGIPATFTITINPAPPATITFDQFPVKTYGDPDFSPGATSTNSTLPVTYTSDNPSIATIVNSQIHITGAGTVDITAWQAGNVSYGAAAPVTQPFTVNKAPLTITADGATKFVGQANPVFVPSFVSFVYGENQSVLTTQPVLSTIATINSPVGQYPISVDGATSPNYDIKQVAGTLTIIPAPKSIVVPNAFTPNGDGVNDVWNIQSLNDFPQCLVSVFSRNGSMVFQSRGYGKPWDGTYNGSPVPTGTYYYIISPQSGQQPLSGYVAVLR